MLNSLKKPVLLTGLKHCGKTSTGKTIAAEFGSDFIDIDYLAEEIYLEECGEKLSSREIYSKGREIFQCFEQKAAARIDSYYSFPVTAAAGGGICDNQTAVDILKKTFVFIYIEEAAGTLFERIIKRGIPAFLSKDDPFNNFLELYRTRTQIYDNLCDIKIRADGRTIREISLEAVLRIKEEGYAGQ